MSNRSLIAQSFMLVILLLIYMVISILGLDFYANILSILIDASATLIIYRSLQNINRNTQHWWVLFSISFFYIFADLLWFLLGSVLQYGNKAFEYLSPLYVYPNIILTLYVGIYIIKNILRKNRIQLIVNTISFAALFLITIFSILSSNSQFPATNPSRFSYMVFFLITNFAITIGMIILLSLENRKTISLGYIISVFAIIMYNTADVIINYIIIFSKYRANSLIDNAYYFVIIAFAISSMLEAYRPALRANVNTFKGDNYIRNMSILSFIQLSILYAYKILTLNSLFLCFFIIMLHTITISFINVGVENESLLKQELKLKEQLDIDVEEKTAALKNANQDLLDLSNRDTLTGLYNRTYLLNTLEELTQERENAFSFILLDIDRFKHINYIYGHDVGDLVLKEIRSRLLPAIYHSDLVYRFGGDEFCIILKNACSYEYLTNICINIIQELSRPMVINDYKLSISPSIGVSRFPQDATTPTNVIRYADIAKSSAKKNTEKLKFCIVDTTLQKKAEREHNLEMLLKTIRFQTEFKIFYQPVFSLPDNKLIGMEALLRWTSPYNGKISPSEFIPVAEKSNLVGEIGDFVMEESFSQIKKWNQSNQLKMSINVSPQQIENSFFTNKLVSLIKSKEINPHWIDIEITERTAMHHANYTKRIFDEIHSYGISISIDDFGTGYSSLSYINLFHVDRLKIAKELIDNIQEDPSDLALVKSIIMMAEGMNLKTVAEGVETKEQYEILKELNCYSIQGYYLGRPVIAEDFEKHFILGW